MRVSRLNPAIAPDGVTGGIIWHDCQMHNTDRVVLSFVLSAVGAGAVAANYVEATGWLRDGERVTRRAGDRPGRRRRVRRARGGGRQRRRALGRGADRWAARGTQLRATAGGCPRR